MYNCNVTHAMSTVMMSSIQKVNKTKSGRPNIHFIIHRNTHDHYSYIGNEGVE